MADNIQALFALEVRHAYFDGASCPAISIRPVDPPPARLAKLGLKFQSYGGKTTVYRRSDGWIDLSAIDLVFEVLATDPEFFAYTETGADDPDSTLWFDTAQTPPDDNGEVVSLHRGPGVSAADRVARDALPVFGPVVQQASSGRIGFVRVRLPPGDSPPKTWFMTFDARATLWEYWVVGATDSPIFVRDLDGKVQFEEVEPRPLAGAPSAVVLRSKAAIPLRHLAPQRFQLIQSAPDGRRVATARLPTPSLSTVALENVDGSTALVCRIRVNI